MKSPALIAFMGPNSQTGTALLEEAARHRISVDVPKNSDGWNTLAERVQKENILLVLPVWNSHEGEITNSRVIELLMEGKAILHKLWPKQIEFECVARVKQAKQIRTVISVPVAEAQCSAFIKRLNAKFVDGGSTVKSYEKFVDDEKLDAVLCVPGTGKQPFVILHQNVANDVNFTTFAIIGNVTTREWVKEWGALSPFFRPTVCSFAAVELSLFSVTSDEDQTVFFNELTSAVKTSADLPRIVFAARRAPDRCGLIVESTFGQLPENILSEDGYTSEIRILPRVGSGPEMYGHRVHKFLRQKFPRALEHPFVRHIGTKPCFFACPALGMLTHGYDLTVVEPVVRRYIAKWFQLVDDGLTCADEERKFFKRFQKAYYASAENFFKFETI